MGQPSRRERILELAGRGMKPRAIAKKLGVSNQWVYQVLKNPVTPSGSKRGASSESLEKARKIIRGRSSWTWNEADEQLEEHGLNFPFPKVYAILREEGFVWKRGVNRWFKGEGE